MSNEQKIAAEALLASIRPNDSVTILIPNGLGRNGPEFKQATGKCVIAPNGRDQHVAVLDMGGRYGTPGVADVRNLVRVGNVRIATPEITDQPRTANDIVLESIDPSWGD